VVEGGGGKLAWQHRRGVSAVQRRIHRRRDQWGGTVRVDGWGPDGLWGKQSTAREANFEGGPEACPIAQPRLRQKKKEAADNVPIAGWFAGINPVLRGYGAAFSDCGYENAGVLAGAMVVDLEEAFEELQVKEPHPHSIPHPAVLAGVSVIG
jgi:hypothetical protein